MSQHVAEAVAEIARPLEELLAGGNHVVSVYVTGVGGLGAAGEPVALVDGIYRAAGLGLRAGTLRPIEHPWRRLHELVDALIPTTASWSVREPPEVELSPDQVDRVTALTHDIAGTLERGIGAIRRAYELNSHDGSYRVMPPDLCCGYDIVWNDLLLLTDDRGALLHVGLSD